MAFTTNTGTATPVIGTETTVASISGGPFDNVSVYFQGGTGGYGGALELALYATVNGFLTRIAQTQVMGTATASIIDWQSPNRGNTESLSVNAGGTAYTVTVLDLSQGGVLNGARQPVTITISGANATDDVVAAEVGAVLTVAANATSALTVLAGPATLMDVAIDQTRLPLVTVTVLADSGAGTVQAAIISAQLSGVDTDIASVFRELALPVALNYTVQLTNNTTGSIAVTMTACTHASNASGGGGGTLSGDVIGPLGSNTVVAWSNVPLLRTTTTGSFLQSQLPDAAVPIFDIGLNEWRAFALSGGATMNNAGVVTVTASALTLTGNDNGPANANRFLGLVVSGGNANVTINDTQGWYWVYMGTLTASRTVSLPASPGVVAGTTVSVSDSTNSLTNTNTIVINGNGASIVPPNGASVTAYTMSAVQNGVGASVTLMFDGTNWLIIAQTRAGTSVQQLSATATFTPLSPNVDVFVDTTAGAVILTLPTPTAVYAGTRFTFKDKTGNFATNSLTLRPPGAVTIEGANSDFVVSAAWARITVICDGSNYYV